LVQFAKHSVLKVGKELVDDIQVDRLHAEKRVVAKKLKFGQSLPELSWFD